MDQGGNERDDPASIQQESVGHPLCKLEIDERENDYAEIGEASTSGRCIELKISISNESQPIEPSSTTIGACNELILSQSHADVSPIEKRCGSEFAEETFPSPPSETGVNFNLGVNLGVNVNQTEASCSLQKSSKETCIQNGSAGGDATRSEEEVLALGEKCESCEIEAASSSTTTYNPIGNFQAGSGGEMDPGEEDVSCFFGQMAVDSQNIISVSQSPHLYEIAARDFEVGRGVVGEVEDMSLDFTSLTILNTGIGEEKNTSEQKMSPLVHFLHSFRNQVQICILLQNIL